MNDGYELAHGYDPFDGIDGLQNDDSDALLNGEESVLGSDPGSAGSPAVLYVDDDNTGGPWDGTAAHPYQTIQAAVDVATPPTLVHVRPGTYVEQVTMASGVGLYGAGAAETIVSPGGSSGATISFHTVDGGVLVGMGISAGTGSYSVSVRSHYSVISLRECACTGGWNGIGINFTGWARIVNCLLADNTDYALWVGGGTWVDVINCTVTDNPVYGLMILCGNKAVLKNTIAYGNGDDLDVGAWTPITVSYCDIGDGDYAGSNGNISANPVFASGPLHDYYLSQTAAGQGVDSPCVDAGSDSAANLGLDQLTTRTDSASDAGTVDMGCHVPYVVQGVITSISCVGNDVTIEWDAVPGTSYVVEWSSDHLVWNPVSVGQTGSWTDVGGGANAQRFYRVRPE